MNSVKIILVYLLIFCSASSCAVDNNTRLVSQVINSVQWEEQINQLHFKSKEQFDFCVYGSELDITPFKQSLKKHKVNKLTIKVKSVVKKETSVACHVLYLENPNKELLEWLVASNSENKTLLIAKGQGYAEQGAHFNIYLNEVGNFELALNADAFENSAHIIKQELLSSVRVVSEKVVKQSMLLSSLLNYTTWPKTNGNFEESVSFEICATLDNSFAIFAQYYLSNKSVKGKNSRLRAIQADESPKSCFVILVNGDNVQLQNLMGKRDKIESLLVGHSKGLGEKGVHYNLLLEKNREGRRFETNLLAFKATGHHSDIQLLNSSKMIKNDYPSIVKIVSEIVQSTESLPLGKPSSGKLSSGQLRQGAIDMCVLHENKLYENLQLFAAKWQKNRKRINAKLLSHSKQNIQCDVVFMGEQQNLVHTLSLIKQSYPAALLITSQTINNTDNRMPMHFNLSIKHNQVNYESYSANLTMAGFVFDKSIIDDRQLGSGLND